MNTGGTGGSQPMDTPPPPAAIDPGHAVLTRLTATQYNNTVRDLFGTALRPGDRFPTDLAGNGEFENEAGHLVVTALHVSLHETAAQELVDEAWKTPAARARVMPCDHTQGQVCLRTAATAFGTRAWRRPVTPAEVDALMALSQKARTAGASADDIAKTVLKAILMSPHFLYRVELDRDPASGVAHPVGDYELATRLSYFLWNSMPDDALLDAARTGKLRDAAGLRAEIDRLLASPRREGFDQSFGGQWLGTVNLEKHETDQAQFRAFDLNLARSMKREVDLLIASMVEGNRPVGELITGRYGHLDQKLAKHYGVPAPATEWQEVNFTTDQRGGILGLGGVLTATSNPNRTSLVKRGQWVLESLLCTEPPPVPDDVPALEASPVQMGTQREILEAHRTDPRCRACHLLIDGMGFALERYNAIGAWRDVDQGRPIDDLGSMPDGTTFKGPRQLAAVLARDPRAQSCVPRQLLAYALGRGLTSADDRTVEALVAQAPDGGVRWKDLIARVVTSVPFRSRRAEGGVR